MRAGRPIGMSTAITAGASGAVAMAANSGTTRRRTSPCDGRTNATIHPARQPSTPASQTSLFVLPPGFLRIVPELIILPRHKPPVPG
jgi:hypothetical protein